MGAAPHDDADMSHQARVARYSHVATALALLSDHRLGRLVAAAQPVGSGIGGTSALLDVGDIPGLSALIYQAGGKDEVVKDVAAHAAAAAR